jgi:protein-S-isoprenylcysteine O-methyltransferase Ste14
MTQEGQSVVEAGPYRFVRHPSYTGMLLTLLGVLLCSTNWLALASFLIALPGLAYRIKVEEGALIGALGEPYRRYMGRTRRIVPRLV